MIQRVWLGIALSIFFKAVACSAAGETETLVGVVGKDFIMLGADSSLSQGIAFTSSNVDKIAVIVDPQLYHEDKNISSEDVGLSETRPRQHAIVAAASGDTADTDRLIGFLQACAAIREYEAGVGCDVRYIDLEATNDKNGHSIATSLVASEPGLDVEAVAHLARGQVAKSIRSRTPLQVSLLLAGMTYSDESPSSIHEFASRQLQWQVEQTAASQSHSISPTNDDVGIDSMAIPLLQPRLFWLDTYGALQELQYGAHGLGSNFILSVLDNGYRPNMNREQAAVLLRECFAQLRQRYLVNSPQPPCIKCVDAKGCHLIAE